MNRHDRGRRIPRRRVVTVLAMSLIALSLIPVPFNVVFADDPVGTVWRLDGRLTVEGRSINPQGRWSFVAIGRPELVIETLSKRARGNTGQTRNVRGGSHLQRPIVAEPIAAVAGLRRAGRDVQVQPVLLVEERVNPATLLTIVAVDGSEQQLFALLDALVNMPADTVITDSMLFTTSDGASLSFTAQERAARRFTAGEQLLEDVPARIRWRTQRFVPQSWFRSLAVGNSHGLMVALATYAHTAEPELARGLHVSGTGAIRTDGTVLNIGGVVAKAKAAHRAGADVFFYPAQHAPLLDTLVLDGMALVPVITMDDAIVWLRERPSLS